VYLRKDSLSSIALVNIPSSLFTSAVFLKYFLLNHCIIMNIYVSNLGYSFQDEDLSKLFGEYGNVSSAKVITDKFTNRSKGFGFVEMSDKQAAETAIRELDGRMVDGRSVKVSEARPREENGNRGNSYAKRW
jgi:RNA recognition motif-containing protein